MNSSKEKELFKIERPQALWGKYSKNKIKTGKEDSFVSCNLIPNLAQILKYCFVYHHTHTYSIKIQMHMDIVSGREIQDIAKCDRTL